MGFLVKLSPQRQLTLPKTIVEEMGSPSHFEGEIVKGELILRKTLHMTVREAELAMAKHGLTREVLMEALRIVDRRHGKG